MCVSQSSLFSWLCSESGRERKKRCHGEGAVNWMQKGAPQSYPRELGFGQGVGAHVKDRNGEDDVTGKEVGNSPGKRQVFSQLSVFGY